MRNGQNNKRMRNRNNNNNNNNNNNRRGQNPMTRVFESNGPDIKIRGTASHVAEKYVQLARDARSSGDPVAAENYYQHAEHYFRLIAAAQEQFRQNQPQPRTDNEMPATEEGEDEGESFSHFGQEPGFVPQFQWLPLGVAVALSVGWGVVMFRSDARSSYRSVLYWACGCTLGSSTAKLEPSPAALRTRIEPPSASRICLTIQSPRPRPP